MTSNNITRYSYDVTKKERTSIKKQKPCVLWFTGLSGSGKSTIANAVEVKLNKLGGHTYLLDGDNIRLGLNRDLTFSDEDRVENIRRIGEVSKLFVDSGAIVLTAFISPFQKERDASRNLVEVDEFIEVFVDTPLEVCESRDPKGLYKRARSGEISNLTGIGSPYEVPSNADITIKTNELSIEKSVKKILNYLIEKKYIND